MRKQGAYYVGLTSLGRVINNYDKKVILNVASKLLTRNKFIISMIHQLLNFGECNYMNCCKNILSEKTSIRRKSNVKHVINEILCKSSYYELLNSIVW